MSRYVIEVSNKPPLIFVSRVDPDPASGRSDTTLLLSLDLEATKKFTIDLCNAQARLAEKVMEQDREQLLKDQNELQELERRIARLRERLGIGS